MSDESSHPASSICGEAPLYALGLLKPHEAAAFLQHVQTCVVCRDEVASLEPAIDALGESAPRFRAPRALRGKVIDAVHAEASVSASLAHRSARKRSWPALPRLQPVALVAGACAILVAGGAIGIAAFGSSSSEDSVATTAQVSYPNATATLHHSGSHLWLTMARMPSPGKGRVYEVWLERGKSAPTPTTALFSPTVSGEADVAVPGNLSGVSEILVTSEPEGGTLKPTRSPVIVGRVSS